MNNDFPFALRIVDFLPFNNYFWVSVRKVTKHPWSVKMNEDGTVKVKEEGNNDDKSDEFEKDDFHTVSTLKIF